MFRRAEVLDDLDRALARLAVLTDRLEQVTHDLQEARAHVEETDDRARP